MTDEKEPNSEPDPKDKTGDGANDSKDKGGNPASGSGGNDSDQSETIRQMVREELAKLSAGGDRSNVPPSRRVDIEAQAEEMVRRATERLKVDNELEELRKFKDEATKKTKEVVEEAPKKVRRLTKAIWGSD